MMGKRGLGIDIGPKWLKVVLLKQGRRQTTILSTAVIELDKDPLSAGVGPALIDQVRREFKKAGIRGKKGLPAIPGREGIFKYFYVPLSLRKNLKPLLKIVATGSSPEGIITGWLPVSGAKPLSKNRLYMAALCKNEILEHGVSLLAKGGGLARHFTLKSTGLSALAQHHGLCRDKSAMMLVELGLKEVNMVILIDNELAYARAFSYAGSGFTERLKQLFPEEEAYLSRSNVQVDLFKAKEGNHGEVFRSIADAVSKELLQGLQTTQTQLKRRDLDVEQVYLCGEESEMTGLPEYLTQVLGRPVGVMDPFEGMKLKPPEHGGIKRAGLSVAAGLALADLHPKNQILSLTAVTVKDNDHFWAHTVYRYYAMGVALLTALFIFASGSYSLTMIDRVQNAIDGQLRNAVGKRDRLLGMSVGLKEAGLVLERLSEGGAYSEQALEIVQELGKITPPDIRLTSLEIKKEGTGFPFDQGDVVHLRGFVKKKGLTEEVFIEKIEGYAKILEQAPGFVHKKFERLAEPQPLKRTKGLASDPDSPWAFQFQFKLSPETLQRGMP